MKRHTGAFAAIAWFWMACPLSAQVPGATIWLPNGSFLTSTHLISAEFETQAKDLVVDGSLNLTFYKINDAGKPDVAVAQLAAALRRDLRPGVAVEPGNPSDLILFAWQPMGGWRSFVASGDKKDLVAYLQRSRVTATGPLGRAFPNEKPPQAVAWQITAVFRATVAPEGVGEIRRLGPTVTNARLAADDAIWVILRFPAGTQEGSPQFCDRGRQRPFGRKVIGLG